MNACEVQPLPEAKEYEILLGTIYFKVRASEKKD